MFQLKIFEKNCSIILNSARKIFSTIFLFLIIALFWFYCYGAYFPWGDKVACSINFVHKEARWCSYRIWKNTSYFNRHIDKCYFSIPGVVEKDPTISNSFSEVAQKTFFIDWVSIDDWVWKCLIYEVKNNKMTNKIRVFDSFHCYFFNMLQYITPEPRDWVLFDIG